jgi:hypothetical protein
VRNSSSSRPVHCRHARLSFAKLTLTRNRLYVCGPAVRTQTRAISHLPPGPQVYRSVRCPSDDPFQGHILAGVSKHTTLLDCMKV